MALPSIVIAAAHTAALAAALAAEVDAALAAALALLLLLLLLELGKTVPPSPPHRGPFKASLLCFLNKLLYCVFHPSISATRYRHWCQFIAFRPFPTVRAQQVRVHEGVSMQEV